ncbi:DUF2283 domain-containing protein [Frigoribacterium sp. PvP120]|uniref:DUF2283 domain-containing protein n=1 Tax=unclassified Frigoribacterium TaxID=2627005 RepID=UPI001AE7F7C8
MSRDERFTHDPDSDCAYLYVAPSIADGEAVEQVVVEREGRGHIVLDFDSEGRLLGVEIVGALALLTAESLETASQTRPLDVGAPDRGSASATPGLADSS